MGLGNPLSDEPDFKYLIAEKEDVVIVLFWGKITGAEVPLLEQCATEIEGMSQQIILINLRDLTALVPGAHAAFSNLQKRVRDLGKLIGISGLRPEVKRALDLAGIIRSPEVFNNIPDAWQTLRYRLSQSKG